MHCHTVTTSQILLYQYPLPIHETKSRAIMMNTTIPQKHRRSVIGLSSVQLQKQRADRLRQRKCRYAKTGVQFVPACYVPRYTANKRQSARKKNRTSELEAETEKLRLQANKEAGERDTLLKLPPISERGHQETLSISSHVPQIWLPSWALIPRNTPPTCPLDTMLGELEAIGRRFESQNFRIAEFMDPDEPVVASLTQQNPISQQPKGEATVSSILVGHVSMSMRVKSTVARLASLWTLFNIVRWRICQSEESFSALPGFFHPTQVQLRITHPQWIDTVPWPAARDHIIQYLDHSQYPRFRQMLNETILIRWSRPVSDCLLVSGKGHYTLSAQFQDHLHDFNNWALGPKAAEEYPFLRETVNISPAQND